VGRAGKIVAVAIERLAIFTLAGMLAWGVYVSGPPWKHQIIPEFPVRSFEMGYLDDKVEQGGVLRITLDGEKIRDDCQNGHIWFSLHNEKGETVSIFDRPTTGVRTGHKREIENLRLPETIHPGFWSVIIRIEYYCPDDRGYAVRVDRPYHGDPFHVIPRDASGGVGVSPAK
jgi:hypothetical protein